MKGRRKEPLAHKVETRLGPAKYRELLDLLAQSQNPNMSSLIRDILANKAVVCKTHDESLDILLDSLAGLKMEIQSIGVNINQVVRHFNGTDPLRKKSAVKKLETLLARVEAHMGRLERMVMENARKWSSG